MQKNLRIQEACYTKKETPEDKKDYRFMDIYGGYGHEKDFIKIAKENDFKNIEVYARNGELKKIIEI